MDCYISEMKRFTDHPRNFDEAVEVCKEVGGKLVEIDSKEEDTAIVLELLNQDFNGQDKFFWIGNFHPSLFCRSFYKQCYDQASVILLQRGISPFFQIARHRSLQTGTRTSQTTVEKTMPTRTVFTSAARTSGTTGNVGTSHWKVVKLSMPCVKCNDHN